MRDERVTISTISTIISSYFLVFDASPQNCDGLSNFISHLSSSSSSSTTISSSSSHNQPSHENENENEENLSHDLPSLSNIYFVGVDGDKGDNQFGHLNLGLR